MVELSSNSRRVLLSVETRDEVWESPEVHGSCVVGEERDYSIDLADYLIILVFEDNSDEHVDAHHDFRNNEGAHD